MDANCISTSKVVFQKQEIIFDTDTDNASNVAFHVSTYLPGLVSVISMVGVEAVAAFLVR